MVIPLACIPICMKNVQSNQATLTKNGCCFTIHKYEKWVGRHVIFIFYACFKNLFEKPFWCVGRATVNRHMDYPTYCVTTKCTISN